MKVPPARLVKIIVTNSGASCPRMMPKMVPRGVAHEKIKSKMKRILNSLNDFYNAILTDMPSANLWMRIANIMLMT